MSQTDLTAYNLRDRTVNHLNILASSFLFKAIGLALPLLVAVLMFRRVQPVANPPEAPAVSQFSQVTSPALAQPLNLDERGRALGGYDPVTYFEAGEARQGDRRFETLWNGAKWNFENAEHQQAFLAEPHKFAPANGGYCTFGVVLRQKLDGDPRVWLIDQDRLYVFLSDEVKQKFLQDRAANFVSVAQNWPDVADVSPEMLN